MSLRNVSKYYRVRGKRRYVLKDINADLPARKSIGILGRNGAGKSTLVRLIARADRPDEGSVDWTPGLNVSWPMGFGGGFVQSLTGRENLRIVSRLYGKDWRDLVDRVEDFAELDKYMDMPISTYSSGMKSRYNFAVSVAMDFDCYLFDELMSVADAQFRHKAEEEMERLAGRSTFIVVSHRMGAIRSYCQCVYLLEAGNLSYFDDVQEGIRAYESL